MQFKPLTGFSLILITLSLGLGTFIQILDSSIANVSIAYIAGDLGVSVNQGTWVITSFAISNAIVIALTGWLSDRIGQVKLFVLSTILFSITSWLCGLAWDLPILIFFRILQGASAGCLIPLSQSLLIHNYPEDKKGTALGFWSMIVVVAPILGPIIGGYITYNYSWPWIFYINIPLGFLSAGITWALLKERESETKQDPIDSVGLSLLILGISSLQILLDKGNELDWFKSPFIQLLLVITLITFVYFIAWNAYSCYPIIDFSLFKDRNFTIGTILGSLGFFMFFGSTVLLPLWLISQLNYTAFWAGVAVMPIGIFPLFLSPLVGKKAGIIDPRLMSTFSFICFSYTFFWFSGFNSDISLYQIMLPRFFQGIGLSFFFIPLLSITLSSIPNKSLASASGVFNFIRLVAGGGFGTSLYVTLWDRREVFHHARLTEAVTSFNPLTSQLYEILKDDLGINNGMTNQIVDHILVREAYLLAINDVFWLSGWTFLLSLPLIWASKRVKSRAETSITSE
jgi:DHA2 family multidrug resistance protein